MQNNSDLSSNINLATSWLNPINVMFFPISVDLSCNKRIYNLEITFPNAESPMNTIKKAKPTDHVWPFCSTFCPLNHGAFWGIVIFIVIRYSFIHTLINQLYFNNSSPCKCSHMQFADGRCWWPIITIYIIVHFGIHQAVCLCTPPLRRRLIAFKQGHFDMIYTE